MLPKSMVNDASRNATAGRRLLASKMRGDTNQKNLPIDLCGDEASPSTKFLLQKASDLVSRSFRRNYRSTEICSSLLHIPKDKLIAFFYIEGLRQIFQIKKQAFWKLAFIHIINAIGVFPALYINGKEWQFTLDGFVKMGREVPAHKRKGYQNALWFYTEATEVLKELYALSYRKKKKED